MTASGPRRAVAGQAETGRACPYCRFPLKAGVDVAACPVCGAAHHGECWDENGGCAVVACAGGPSDAAGATDWPAADTVAQPVGTATLPMPAPPRQRTSPWLIAALFALALAVAAVAAAVLLSSGGDQAAVTAAPSPPPPETVTEPAPPPPPPEPEPEPQQDGLLPDVSDPEIEIAIEQALHDHHQAVVAGDFERAWALLTKRKQAQNRVKYGYATWRANQATLSPYLDPSGIDVSLLDLDPSTGEATVMVRGMTWTKPGAGCSEWSGITWMKYENGDWRYDPGYSTTPERERLWKPRFSELLGASC